MCELNTQMECFGLFSRVVIGALRSHTPSAFCFVCNGTRRFKKTVDDAAQPSPAVDLLLGESQLHQIHDGIDHAAFIVKLLTHREAFTE